MRRCRSLSTLPQGFGKLRSLQILNLSECDKLEELCGDFHYLAALKELYLSRCYSLTKLPPFFGKLKSLQLLDLSKCDKLEELCGDFHCLGALKELYLSGCSSLTKLPHYFGQLCCLENANLSGCSNLAKLSDNFHTLPSLMRLNLSNCKRLGGEWMDRVGAIQSLWYVDISGSEGMTHRWMEMRSEKEEWHLVVVAESSSKDTEETQWSLILKKIICKIFSKEGFRIGAHQRHFYSSSLPSCLILIIQRLHVNPEKWRLVQTNLEHLPCNSKASAIIYVGTEFDALPVELVDRTVAHSPFDSFMNNFKDVFPGSLWTDLGVFASTIDGVERNTVKYLSTWEDISYIKSEVDFLVRNPRQSNVELLRKLCVTQENDFLLRNNEQVKVQDLEGKVVLLLIACFNHKLHISALEDVYRKLQRSSEYRAEVVWIPRVEVDDNPEEYKRIATPWLTVPNPWLIDRNYLEGCVRYSNGVVVVDEKGSISHENAMPMILRWGIKAYPFSASREEELRKMEWKEFNFSSQSSLEFIFQNLELYQSTVREVILRGEMIFVCAGRIDEMLEFLPQLNHALTKLEKVIQVFYVGSRFSYGSEYDMKIKEMCNVTSLSSYDVDKFWERVTYLWDGLGKQGVDKRIVQVRSMVLAFDSASQWWIGQAKVDKKVKGLSIIAVDENGEMINGRGEEIVQMLCQSDEEEHDKLMSEIKSEGFSHVLRRRWRDETFHHKDHPDHPLVGLYQPNYNGVRCDACFHVIDFDRQCYRCSVCEKYEICQKCVES